MSATAVYLLALGANLFFSTASLVFSVYARRFSPFWINQLKVVIALALFGGACLYTGHTSLSVTALSYLLFSGLIGLCVGDLFLFKAYATLGAGRSLVLYSFQPMLLGLYGWFFLGQGLSGAQLIAVICMMSCLGVFMLERNKLTGRWDLQSFLWAFTGIVLDAIGVMLTREAYELTPALDAMQVNFIRCAGAMLGYLCMRPKGLITLGQDLLKLKGREQLLLFTACVCGTVVSLSLYLSALKHAHLASLTAVAITGPLWVSLLECVWARALPNRYQTLAFLFFLVGFAFML